MSATPSAPLAALLPGLPPELAAGLIGQLLAAVPRRRPDHDPAGTDRELVRQLADLRPRDSQEAMLAVQLLAAHHTAILCLAAAAAALDIAGKEASRLRRDAAVQQRAEAMLYRTLLRAQARPLQADAAEGEARPVVLPVQPRAAATRPARAAARAEEAAPEPFPPPGLFDDQPELKRLAERWESLPPWEQMSMQERRETWGYKPEAAGEGPARGTAGA